MKKTEKHWKSNIELSCNFIVNYKNNNNNINNNNNLIIPKVKLLIQMKMKWIF